MWGTSSPCQTVGGADGYRSGGHLGLASSWGASQIRNQSVGVRGGYIDGIGTPSCGPVDIGRAR